MSCSPKDVGVLGMELYIPKRYVDQAELEAFDGVSEGKYTIGLGQRRMSFAGDCEDIASVCMTALKRLLDHHKLKSSDIGRLEVGTETIIDKSKSTKTTLMQLFPEGDVEGIDMTNACYGGTNAMFAALDWIESPSWNGKLAVVLAGDIAVYERGPARPTGGCGVVAVLMGPNAPLVFSRGIRSVHMEHVWDFFKPKLASEYPEVDGKLSLVTYLRSLDKCYGRFCDRWQVVRNEPFDFAKVEYVAMHTPYIGLVKKAFSRLVFLELLQKGVADDSPLAPIKQYMGLTDPEQWIGNRECVSLMGKLLKPDLVKRVVPGLDVSQNVGNMYCGALSGAILSVCKSKDIKKGDKILCFSYGSGLAAAMFLLEVKGNLDMFCDVHSILENREKATCQVFTDTMLQREEIPEKDFVPKDRLDHLLPNTYYLKEIDGKYRRHYALKE